MFIKNNLSNGTKKFSFSKSERLHKTKEFQEVYTKGKVYRSDYLLLFVLSRGENQEIPNVRIGIVVSRKVGKAVKRNKLKRRLREIFRLNKHFIKPGVDIVINAKKTATELNFSELKEVVLNLFKKAGIFNG